MWEIRETKRLGFYQVKKKPAKEILEFYKANNPTLGGHFNCSGQFIWNEEDKLIFKNIKKEKKNELQNSIKIF